MVIVMQARDRRSLAGVGSEKRLDSGDIGRQAGVGCGKRDGRTTEDTNLAILLTNFVSL